MIKTPAIPDDAEITGGNSNYLKLTPGTHRIRVVAPATIGIEWWEDENGNVRQPGDKGKAVPKRVKIGEAVPVKAGGATKTFWALPVWAYTTNTLQILSVTQPSIQRELKKLDHDKDWGNLTGYDIEIDREGSGQYDTSYSVTPKPKKPLEDDIKEQLSVGGLPRMEAMFDGEDPFAESVEIDMDSLPF